MTAHKPVRFVTQVKILKLGSPELKEELKNPAWNVKLRANGFMHLYHAEQVGL